MAWKGSLRKLEIRKMIDLFKHSDENRLVIPLCICQTNNLPILQAIEKLVLLRAGQIYAN